MARTVADLKLLFEAMAGPDDGDPFSAPAPLRPVSETELRGLQIGFFEDDGRTPVTSETRAAVTQAAELLLQRGLRVERFLPNDLEESRQLWWKLFGTAGGMVLRSMFRGRESELSPILSEFLSWTAAEPAHTGESLLATWLARDDVRERVLLQMRNYPVLLCPTAAIPAFCHGEREWQVEGQTVKYLDAWSYCEWFNLLGFPAVVVPMGFSTEGLPIGVQIVGRPWEEELVLEIAILLEDARGPYPQPAIASE
jgi:Asp-tRNA(Asn)/Glu-tRNA(Gln) amidotransferase A subunit family amidase